MDQPIPAIIELKGVDVVHADATEPLPLMRAVDWRIGPGEFWVVGGPPGSGVSMLLLTAAGLNRPGDGTLCLFGRELAQATEAEQVDWRRRIGFVFERGGRLLSHLTVAQNVALPLVYHTALDEADIAARVQHWLELTDLAGCAQQMPSQLTPRLQQRASFVRAQVLPSEVLFVDDPPVRLGPAEARWWANQLGRLCQQGVSVVVGSSYFRAWLEGPAPAQFALLQEGRFVVIGEAEQVRAQRGAAWRELVSID